MPIQWILILLLLASAATAFRAMWIADARTQNRTLTLFVLGLAALDWLGGQVPLSLPKLLAAAALIMLGRRMSSNGEADRQSGSEGKRAESKGLSQLLLKFGLGYSLVVIAFVFLGTLARQTASPKVLLPPSYLLYLGLALFLIGLFAYGRQKTARLGELFPTISMMLWGVAMVVSAGGLSSGAVVATWLLASVAAGLSWIADYFRAGEREQKQVQRDKATVDASQGRNRSFGGQLQRVLCIAGVAGVLAWVYARPDLVTFMPNSLHSFGGLRPVLQSAETPGETLKRELAQ